MLNLPDRIFPVPPDDFVTLLANFTQYYEDNNGPAPDVSGAVATSRQDANSRDDRARDLVETYQAIRFHIDTDEPKLAYMFIVVNTTLDLISSGSDVRPIYDSWSNLIQKENSRQDNQGL